MRPRISIRGFVRWSVRWSVGPSVRQAFLKHRGNRDLRTTKYQGTHRIAFLVEIQENSAKFKKIQENSAIYWTHHCLNRTCFNGKKYEKHENCSTGVAYGSWQYWKGCSSELSPGSPWGGLQGKMKSSSEPYWAYDYATFTALGDLILCQHTHIFLLNKVEEDAYWKDFIRPQEGGPKWPPHSTKLSAEPTK